MEMERRATPNDPKLSDGRGWRGPCMAGGKAAAEAGAVTATPVRCSAWLGALGNLMIFGKRETMQAMQNRRLWESKPDVRSGLLLATGIRAPPAEKPRLSPA